MIKVNWLKDYKYEFKCPKCGTLGLRPNGKSRDKKKFYCKKCKRETLESCQTHINQKKDPNIDNLSWYTGYRIPNFICPNDNCLQKNIFFIQFNENKAVFSCKSCKKRVVQSNENSLAVRSTKTTTTSSLKEFNFESNFWDLRTINSNYDPLNNNFTVNFSEIEESWFKIIVKKYILSLCKMETPLGSIHMKMASFKCFAKFISAYNIKSFDQINRTTILSYISQTKINLRRRLIHLKSFFEFGTNIGCFAVEQDIIRSIDIPKQEQTNPEPLSKLVVEQIEKNIDKLPQQIGRMWFICKFAAMRPSELALLKKNCLIQEGQNWKVHFFRKKGRDYHEVPVPRYIAKLIQIQQKYIENLFGNNWEYLFCHYHGLSNKSISKINLVAQKKVLPVNGKNPLVICIRTLIKELDIKDENNQLAEFKNKSLRTTRATHLFEQGHELSIISAWLGHKHYATTSNYYTEVSCKQIEKATNHIQKALVNCEGQSLKYESYPKSFWENPIAHELELSGTHLNTPIYGSCGLDLTIECDKGRACYTCTHFVATLEKLPQYIKLRDELRSKQSKSLESEQDVLAEQFSRQADQLDKIIASLQEAA